MPVTLSIEKKKQLVKTLQKRIKSDFCKTMPEAELKKITIGKIGEIVAAGLSYDNHAQLVEQLKRQDVDGDTDKLEPINVFFDRYLDALNDFDMDCDLIEEYSIQVIIYLSVRAYIISFLDIEQPSLVTLHKPNIIQEVNEISKAHFKSFVNSSVDVILGSGSGFNYQESDSPLLDLEQIFYDVDNHKFCDSMPECPDSYFLDHYHQLITDPLNAMYSDFNRADLRYGVGARFLNLILGLCRVSSEEQLFHTLEQLKSIGVREMDKHFSCSDCETDGVS